MVEVVWADGKNTISFVSGCLGSIIGDQLEADRAMCQEPCARMVIGRSAYSDFGSEPSDSDRIASESARNKTRQ